MYPGCVWGVYTGGVYRGAVKTGAVLMLLRKSGAESGVGAVLLCTDS